MNSDSKSTRLHLAGFGALGALAPDALVLYTKRFTMPSLEFSWSQYLFATALYVVLAAIVAAIFPYPGRKSSWKGFCTGFGLPVVLSGILALQRDPILVPKGGATLAGTLLDLMSLF